jgi:hypothetical protein
MPQARQAWYTQWDGEEHGVYEDSNHITGTELFVDGGMAHVW